MIDKWTKRSLDIENWLKNNINATLPVDVDAMRYVFDTELERLENIYVTIEGDMAVFLDDTDSSDLEDSLLNPEQWDMVLEYKLQ